MNVQPRPLPPPPPPSLMAPFFSQYENLFSNFLIFQCDSFSQLKT